MNNELQTFLLDTSPHRDHYFSKQRGTLVPKLAISCIHMQKDFRIPALALYPRTPPIHRQNLSALIRQLVGFRSETLVNCAMALLAELHSNALARRDFIRKLHSRNKKRKPNSSLRIAPWRPAQRPAFLRLAHIHQFFHQTQVFESFLLSVYVDDRPRQQTYGLLMFGFCVFPRQNGMPT